jgi:hypothetical protein
MISLPLSHLSCVRSVIILGIFAAALDAAQGAQADPELAMNQPARFAWETFVAINKPADPARNDTIWETWATDADTFPKKPDVQTPPTWPGGKPRAKELGPSTQFLLLNRLRGTLLPQIMPSGNQQEVRRNESSFNYIVKNNLWHLDGLKAAYAKRAPITFPTDAIEIKAMWLPIDETQKPRFHWNHDASGKLFGLVALHISTKALPNWFWSTFEHVDNPDRGKDLGVHDDFGITPANTIDGRVSGDLKSLFNGAHLGDEWENYRLAGTQTDFVDSTGNFTRMGNSIIERGNVAKSSCTNCHAMARVNGTEIGGFDFIVGIPDKNMFYFSDGSLQNLQLDFVWGFAFAQPLTQPSP